jgi:hypothetical protein
MKMTTFVIRLAFVVFKLILLPVYRLASAGPGFRRRKHPPYFIPAQPIRKDFFAKIQKFFPQRRQCPDWRSKFVHNARTFLQHLSAQLQKPGAESGKPQPAPSRHSQSDVNPHHPLPRPQGPEKEAYGGQHPEQQVQQQLCGRVPPAGEAQQIVHQSQTQPHQQGSGK